jgi:hypothetical protein
MIFKNSDFPTYVGSACGSASYWCHNLDPDPVLDRHQNGNWDPARHHNDADPQIGSKFKTLMKRMRMRITDLPCVSTMFGLDLELVSVLGPHVFPFTPSAGTEPHKQTLAISSKGKPANHHNHKLVVRT